MRARCGAGVGEVMSRLCWLRMCRQLTAPWAREKAKKDSLCTHFEKRHSRTVSLTNPARAQASIGHIRVGEGRNIEIPQRLKLH